MLSCCLNSSAYEKWGFPVQKKWGCPFDLFFQEQFLKTLIKINLIWFLAVIHTLIKRFLCYKEIFNNTLHIQEKNQNNMLSFNPISSQSRATQNLKNVRRGLFPLKSSLRRDGWQGECVTKFCVLICNTGMI